jgi:uncharacterized protein YecE (DUF72 family)
VPLTRDERRERRDAKRAAERVRSVARADAMRLARRTDTTPANGASGLADSAPYWVGTSGWYYWHWRDCFYPQGAPSSGWFAHFKKHFRTVELNAPFYSWPAIGTVKSWLRQAGRNRFVYTVKANELITHVKRFARTKELVQDFYHIGTLLGPHMGCFLFQLPPSFRYDARALDRIIAQMDPRWRNVVEFRHKSWWNERVFARFRDANIIFCSCSGPRLPDELITMTDDVYIRFHGTTQWYRHNYTREELSLWTNRIRASGAKRVWAYFNNDREGYAIKNAKELVRQLRQGHTLCSTSNQPVP